MEKESFLEKIKKIKYFFIEKPKNKQKEEDIIQINEVDKEDETFNTENQVEILNEENQIDEELNIDDQVEVLNAVNPMEEVEEPIEQKTDEIEETQKEYTTVDYNSILKEQEERIKKAGTIPEEEKQKQIDELYKNFELFVGEINNSGKTR